MTTLTQQDKDAMVLRIRKEVKRHIPKERMHLSCLYHAVCTIQVLTPLLKQRVILQAGTHSWPRIRPEEDDGVIATHFSYVWEPDSATTRLALRENRLPEMHCWAALPETQEIIDLTTCYLPQQCRRLGMEWTAPDPPDYFWGGKSDLPTGVRYTPDEKAIKTAIALHTKPPT